MKITAFNPILITPKADETIELFEALGFERRHQKDGIDGEDISSVDLKNPDGFRVDVTLVPQMPQAMTSIRMSVRDFDEAYDMLEKKGFTHPGGRQAVETASNKSAMMTSPSGFAFDLCQHIKED
jgi:hypothetical protein